MKIIVVGASSGIGHLVGECLERRGDSVVGIARRDPSDWAGQFWTLMLSADASEETTLRDAFRQARVHMDGVDAVLNCTGAFAASLLLQTPAESMRRALHENVTTSHSVLVESTRLLRRNGGTVLSVSSVAAHHPLVGNGVYGASKAALERLIRSFALENRALAIHYLGIAVTFVDGTPMVNSLGAEARSKYEPLLANTRSVAPEDIVAIIDFMQSEVADLVSGLTIPLGFYE